MDVGLECGKVPEDGRDFLDTQRILCFCDPSDQRLVFLRLRVFNGVFYCERVDKYWYFCLSTAAHVGATFATVACMTCVAAFAGG